jgi:hypothetical protein
MRSVSAVLIVMLGLVACGGGGSSANMSRTEPLPCPAITAAQDPTLALVSPANGATGVAVTVGSVTFSATFSYDTLTLTPSDGSAVVAGGPVMVSNGRDTSAVPVLRSGVTYQVMVRTMPTALGFPACSYAFTNTIGSFTTQ